MKVRELIAGMPKRQAVKLITRLGRDPVEYCRVEELLKDGSEYLDCECTEWYSCAIDKNTIAIHIKQK